MADPFVEDIYGEHSISQLWVETGNCEYWSGPNTCTTGANGNAVQSVEVGWVVGNGQTDGYPHLFVFSTQDGYYQKACYAGLGGNCCPKPGSGQGTDCWVPNPGAQYMVNQQLGWYNPGHVPAEMIITVWNGTLYGYPYWYVYIDSNLIGWYPSSTFTGQMQNSATYLQVGGEVYDEWPNNSHTTTQMGSGIPPTSASGHGYEFAAYHRNVTYIDSSINYHNASLQAIVTPSGDLDEGIPGVCGYEAGLFYNLSSTIAAGASGWGTYFYYGGGAHSY